MEFKGFVKQVNEQVKDARRDATIHLKMNRAGEISVICGYVSPDYSDDIISRNHFSVGDYVAGRVDLREAFYYMMEDIKHQTELEELARWAAE